LEIRKVKRFERLGRSIILGGYGSRKCLEVGKFGRLGRSGNLGGLEGLGGRKDLQDPGYSAYDRELLAVYEAVKHFRHMLEARHFIIFIDNNPITCAFQQKRDTCSPRQFNHLDFIAQLTTDIYVDRTTLSPMLSLALNPSPRHHLTTHWPQSRTVTTNVEHFWRRAPPCGSRGNKFPAPPSPSAATHLPEASTVRSCFLTAPSVPVRPRCHTLALKQQRSWSHNVSCG
jgi:hypothetical protein